MTAKFIVIEGLEGAGKSTAIALCQAYLEEHGIDFVNTREPGGTPVAESLREIVKSDHDEKVAGETELLLMYAARAQLVTNVIRPALAHGRWVLGDRHDLSSQAYQGGGRGIEQDVLNTLSNLVLKGLKPDLTLYLDIDPEIGLARAGSRGELDRIEQEDLSFFHRTRARYLALAEQDPSIVIIQAGEAIENVHGAIKAALDTFLAHSL